MYGDALYASSQIPYAEYASPRDSGFVSRTSVMSSSGPLQRKFVLNGSASLESSPIMRSSAAAASHFMTPQPSHRKIVQGTVRWGWTWGCSSFIYDWNFYWLIAPYICFDCKLHCEAASCFKKRTTSLDRIKCSQLYRKKWRQKRPKIN